MACFLEAISASTHTHNLSFQGKDDIERMNKEVFGSNPNVHRQMNGEGVVPIYNGIFSSVQSLSRVRLFATP